MSLLAYQQLEPLCAGAHNVGLHINQINRFELGHAGLNAHIVATAAAEGGTMSRVSPPAKLQSMLQLSASSLRGW